MNHLKSLLILACCLFAFSALAQDVPPHLVHQGRLLDALNVPVTGPQDLTFNLYSTETGGAAFWTETQTVSVNEGFYSVTLGQSTGLDLDQFTGDTLYLGVTVAGEELAPRLALRSVPYAIKARSAQTATSADTATTATTAENVTGDITPSSVTVAGTVIDANGITINGATIIDGSGQWSGPEPTVDYNNLINKPTTLDDMPCAENQILEVSSGVWACANHPDSDTLLDLSCAVTQVAKFDGLSWACADDTDTTYTAGSGITLIANNIAADTNVVQARVFGVCSDGFSIRQINTDGSVICEPDTDTTYSAASGGGLVLSGANAFGIDADAIRSIHILDGQVTNADLADNVINSAKIIDGTVTSTDIANGTIVAADVNTTSLQVQVSGVCAAGSSIRAISTTGTVTCEPDDDTNTTYTAGTGLTLSAANQFDVSSAYVRSEAVAGVAAASPGIAMVGKLTTGNARGTVSSATTVTTASTAFADVPAMTVTVNTGAAMLLIMADIPGITNSTTDNTVNFRLTLDGAAVGSIAEEEQMTTGGVWSSSVHALVPVTAGSHTIRLQWSVQGGTGSINSNESTQFGNRTLSVIEL